MSLDARDKQALINLTTRIVAGQVAKGEVNADDPDALMEATRKAAKVARDAYLAALDFLK